MVLERGESAFAIVKNYFLFFNAFNVIFKKLI